ncbi:hypothetical protein BGZ61DRAFT_92312 [Ilyonectria robusta]|uniref:uncharacterized protein n=1 Tax=Ilyonectria robusta TaxID=1079257 RepID=UPI001E8DBD02|nr:uncharacterized protein BGZ61DRAFT_92312 [Ilyonectria robusta]KAH8736246.1 hypothetical protein BGZ61DRAFT_92312 [Ilyonectria robusta]
MHNSSRSLYIMDMKSRAKKAFHPARPESQYRVAGSTSSLSSIGECGLHTRRRRCSPCHGADEATRPLQPLVVARHDINASVPPTRKCTQSPPKIHTASHGAICSSEEREQGTGAAAWGTKRFVRLTMAPGPLIKARGPSPRCTVPSKKADALSWRLYSRILLRGVCLTPEHSSSRNDVPRE